MASNVIDFVSKRKEKIEKKRRRFERILFREYFSVETAVATDDESYPVDLIDVSPDGCLFGTFEKATPNFAKVGSKLTLKIYFAEHNYIPVSVSVKRTKKIVEKNGRSYREYGCVFDKSLSSFQAMEALINFVYKLAEHSYSDVVSQKIHFV